ncbi:MAG TPA: GntR family transcriptional regulator [Chloroflexota bacterium]
MTSGLSMFDALTYRTIHDQVYQTLYEAILQGRLEPGARLVEAELGLALGVSRGPIREAIRRLESEGLVLTRAHRDTHVISLTALDVIELYSVRAVLEGFAAVSALAVLRSDHLSAMELQLEDLDRAALARDWDRVAVLDAQWHSHITTAAGNKRLITIWTHSNGPLRVLFARAAGAIYRPEQMRERHANLLEILRTEEPVTIEHAIREHYLSSAHLLAAHAVQDGNQAASSGEARMPAPPYT